MCLGRVYCGMRFRLVLWVVMVSGLLNYLVNSVVVMLLGQQQWVLMRLKLKFLVISFLIVLCVVRVMVSGVEVMFILGSNRQCGCSMLMLLCCFCIGVVVNLVQLFQCGLVDGNQGMGVMMCDLIWLFFSSLCSCVFIKMLWVGCMLFGNSVEKVRICSVKNWFLCVLLGLWFCGCCWFRLVVCV